MVSLEPVYSVSELALDGATSVDTGVNLFDEDKDWTIVTKWSGKCTGLVVVWSIDLSAGTSDHNSLYLGALNGWYWRIRLSTAGVSDYTAVMTQPWTYVLTRSRGSNTMTVYSVVDGVKKTTEMNINGGLSSWIGATNNLVLGYSNFTESYFAGTINTLDVYERVLDASEINEYLGV